MKKLLAASLLMLPGLAFSQGYRSEMIQETYSYQIKGDKLVETVSVILQINERQGDPDAQIEIPYSKSENLSIGEAWIEDMFGQVIRKLKSKEIEETNYNPDYSLYRDYFIKSFELKHNTYPYRIVYSYTKTYPRYSNIAVLNYTDCRTPVRDGILRVETTADRAIKYKQANVGEPQIDTTENKLAYTWKFSYTPPYIREINSSPNLSPAPSIYVAPEKFKYGKEGSMKDWASLGNWIYRLNYGSSDDLPQSEKDKVALLVEGVTDNVEKARILYHYLEDYNRYVNVSIKLGGLQTYPASYVSQNRYGDCKALSNYMQALLKQAGIASYYTIIHADDTVEDIDPEFTANVFNHIILTVPMEKDTVFLECTSKHCPFGYMGTQTQGRKALLVDETNSRLIDIPPLKAQDILCTRNIEVDLKSSQISISTVSRGSDYELNRSLDGNIVDKNTTDKFIRNTILVGSYDLSDFRFLKNDRDTPAIGFEAKLRMDNIFKDYGNNLVLESFPSRQIPPYEIPEKRTLAVQLDYPLYCVDTIKYILGGRKIAKTPENVSIKSEYGEFSLRFEITGDALIVSRSLLMHSGRYPISEYKGFYEFVMNVKKAEEKKILVVTV